MRYNVAQLLKEPTGATRHYQLDEDVTGLDPHLVPTSTLHGNITMLWTGTSILVTGRLVTRVETVCSRCLEPLEVALDIDVEEEFRPTVDIVTGRRLPVEEEDTALWIDAHHILDLTEVLRQNLLLALPSHPLCRENCAGICPECGQNLNEKACNCMPREMDPGWFTLSGLKLD